MSGKRSVGSKSAPRIISVLPKMRAGRRSLSVLLVVGLTSVLSVITALPAPAAHSDIYDLVLTQGCDPQQETGTKAPSGSCTLTGELNIKERHIESIEITFSGLAPQDTIAAAHLHEGAVGVDGNPVVTLFGAGQTSPYNCTTAPCGGHSLTQAQVDDFIAGNGYINIFTVQYSNGWVRGQIKANQRSAAAPTIQVDKTADPLERAEPGGTFTFDVVVTNTGPIDVTIASLTDDIYGDLNDPANPDVANNTCEGAVGTSLDPDETFTCSFDGEFTGVAGDSETDTVTVLAEHDIGEEATDSGSATVQITEAPVDPTVNLDASIAAGEGGDGGDSGDGGDGGDSGDGGDGGRGGNSGKATGGSGDGGGGGRAVAGDGGSGGGIGGDGGGGGTAAGGDGGSGDGGEARSGDADDGGEGGDSGPAGEGGDSGPGGEGGDSGPAGLNER